MSVALFSSLQKPYAVKIKMSNVDHTPHTQIKTKYLYQKSLFVFSDNARAVSWLEEDVVSSTINIQPWAARNVIQLLDEGCTIPFIARYHR